MSVLAVREVSKRFGGVNALAGVTFTTTPPHRAGPGPLSVRKMTMSGLVPSAAKDC